MKILTLKYCILICSIVISNCCLSQTNLLLTRPTEFNGGLVGNENTNRLSFNSDLIALREDYKGFNSRVSYDWMSQKLKGGVGAYLSGSYSDISMLHWFGAGKSDSQKIGLVYSPKFLLNLKKLTVAPFVDISFFRVNRLQETQLSSIDLDIFFDRIKNNSYGLSLKVGALVNTDNWIFGYSFSGLNQTIDKANYQRLFYLQRIQAGKYFSFNKAKKVGLSAILESQIRHLSYQTIFFPSLINLNFKWDRLHLISSIGVNKVWTNLDTSIGIGYKKDNKWKIGYSISLPNNRQFILQEVGWQLNIKSKNNYKP